MSPWSGVTVATTERDHPGAACVEEWVSKPIDETALLAALERALSGGASTKVLVVEDDLGLAPVLSAMFERNGLVTVNAHTVRQALEICRLGVPDLLVLDLMLPDGNGAEIVDFLRHDDRFGDVPVVIYTAQDLNEAERAGLQLGRTHFFTKGHITPAELERRIMALLEEAVTSEVEEGVAL